MIILPYYPAMTLESEGVTNYKILEATDHIGGRSYTVNESWDGEDIPIDLGSMWLHGGSQNPLHSIVLQQPSNTIPTFVSTYNEKIYKADNGGPLTDAEVTNYYNQLYENGWEAYQAGKQDCTDNDESLQISANEYYQTLSSAFEVSVAKNFLRNLVELEYSAKMSRMSLWWWDNDEWTGGPDADDYFLPEGYSSLIGAYAAPVIGKVQMNSVVTRINYKNKNTNVAVVCDDKRYLAKRVIITVPLGVLKDAVETNSIWFKPKLPKRIRRSIRQIGMGNMNKIFLFWKDDEVFWPRNTEILSDVVERDADFVFFNPQPYNDGKPFLFAFFAGAAAAAIEADYKEMK